MKTFTLYAVSICILLFTGCNKSSPSGTATAGLPVIPGNSAASSISASEIVITSSISSDGGDPVSSRGVCWGTSPNPTVAGNHTTDGSGTGTFTSTISDLNPQTTYYARSYATNSQGTAYGNELRCSTPAPDVFVVGYEENGTYSNARLWKNGVGTTLSTLPTKQSWARGVYVVKEDVYAVGYEFDGIHYTARLWKNNVAASLTNGVLDAQAFSVFVSAGDVYIAGYQSDASGKTMATLWKNGVATLLPGGGNNGQATSVLVSGPDVYVTGYDGTGPSAAKLWKNGVATDLPGTNAVAYSVYKAGSDIYVVGANIAGGIAIAQVWKNALATSLTNGNQIAIAYGVAGFKNDIYIAGFEANGGAAFARLWKNGTAGGLTDGSNYARSNAVSTIGQDVYVTGYERINNISVTKTWKNGVNIYSSNGTFNAAGFSIFIR